ncbi:MAG TPA: DUF2905 domain-containing protein [Spirochaetota bacterium]|nr:DUF2905 domain-containing protein [Spirochaetota bacterium]HQQ49667.1 DUF2905 domain-containing protein [Spirochaetota bacterium]
MRLIIPHDGMNCFGSITFFNKRDVMGRTLIGFGILFIIIGILLQLSPKLLGNLPGDVVFTRGRVTVYLPFTTMIIISVILTIIINGIARLLK